MYTVIKMLRNRSITLALVAHAILGNVCFMPMAFAHEVMPMDHDMQEMEEITEMVMTPANAISPIDCGGGCVTVIRPKFHTGMEGGRMPCNDGHCLSGHQPSTAVTQNSQNDVVKIPVRLMPFLVIAPEANDVLLKSREDPDIRPLITQTIVLRE